MKSILYVPVSYPVITWSLHHCADLRPKITEQPRSLRKYCNEQAVFTVTANGPGTMVYQWKKDGKDIMNEKLYERARSNELSIACLQSKHAGQYSCIVENEHGKTTSKTVNLTLKVKISEEAQNRSAHFGEKVIISVLATGQEPLEYLWKKDGKKITDHEIDIYGGITSSKLTIRSMSEELQGNYQCVVSNAVDEEESCKISLIMERKQRKCTLCTSADNCMP